MSQLYLNTLFYIRPLVNVKAAFKFFNFGHSSNTWKFLQKITKLIHNLNTIQKIFIAAE